MVFWLVSPVGIHQMTWLHNKETASGPLRRQQQREGQIGPCCAQWCLSAALQPLRRCPTLSGSKEVKLHWATGRC